MRSIQQRLLAITFLLSVSHIAQSVTPEEAKTVVESQYQVTTRSVMGGIKAPGTVLVVQQEGIRAEVPKFAIKPAVIEGGKLTSTGGGGAILGGNSGHEMKVGDRVLLYGVQPNKDSVVLLVATVDTFETVRNGSSASMPYEAAVSFRYGDALATMTADALMSDIKAWFKSEAESSSGSTKTIALGQTQEQVVAAMGPPEKKVELGKKIIYTYKDLKVVFQDGKVADVE